MGQNRILRFTRKHDLQFQARFGSYDGKAATQLVGLFSPCI